MFNMIFRMFLVCFLLTAAASGLLDRKNAVQALYARCLSVICIVMVILSGVGLFATGKWSTVTTFLGSVPIVILCFAAAFLVWKRPKKDNNTQDPISELPEDKSADNFEVDMEYSEEGLWESEDIYEVYAESQDDKEPPFGQGKVLVSEISADKSSVADSAENA